MLFAPCYGLGNGGSESHRTCSRSAAREGGAPPPPTAPQAGRGLSPSPTCTGPLPSKQYRMGRLTSELSSSAQLLSRCPLGPRPPWSSHLDIGVWGTQVCVGQSRQLLQLQQQGSVLQGPGQGGLVQGQGCWLSESPASVSAQPCLEAGSGEQSGLLFFSRRAGVWGGRDLRERCLRSGPMRTRKRLVGGGSRGRFGSPGGRPGHKLALRLCIQTCLLYHLRGWTASPKRSGK